MGVQGSGQDSCSTAAVSETQPGHDFALAESCDEGLRLRRLPRLREGVKEVISTSRGRLALLVCWDICTVLTALHVGYSLSPRYDFEMALHIGFWTVAPILVFSFIFSAMAAGLYERPHGEGNVSLVLRSTVAAFVAWALVSLWAYVATFAPIGRWIVGISGASLVLVSSSGRLILRYLQKRMPVNVIVLGDEQVAQSIRRSGERRNFPPLRVSAMASMSCDAPLSLSALAPGGHAGNHNEINWIVVQGNCEGRMLDDLIPLFRNGTRICDVSTFFETFFQKVPAEVIDTNWLIQANVSLGMLASRAVKRTADVVGSLLGLLLTIPLWPAIAVAVKASSKGPIFYVQERVGRHGKIFRIIKFRTMTVDAEASGGAIWASRRDPRVTRVGRLLRKIRLDEIPQFVNVLLGDMSLVGPRPERPVFVKMLTEEIQHYQLRHLVRPGITGWAQVNYRYGASFEDAV